MISWHPPSPNILLHALVPVTCNGHTFKINISSGLAFTAHIIWEVVSKSVQSMIITSGEHSNCWWKILDLYHTAYIWTKEKIARDFISYDRTVLWTKSQGPCLKRKSPYLLLFMRNIGTRMSARQCALCSANSLFYSAIEDDNISVRVIKIPKLSMNTKFDKICDMWIFFKDCLVKSTYGL